MNAAPSPSGRALSPGNLVLRSLLGFGALLLLWSTPWIGPYGFAAATIAWWLILQRIR